MGSSQVEAGSLSSLPGAEPLAGVEIDSSPTQAVTAHYIRCAFVKF